MLRRILTMAILVAGIWQATSAKAQEVVLKLHHFTPPQAVMAKNFFAPWAKKIGKESKGRVKINIFPSMQLGGRPPALYTQAKDGMVDISWAVAGYTPGRFLKSQVFELPFMATNAEATSAAAWEFYTQYLKDEYKDVKVLAIHTHGPGIIHSNKSINSIEDLKGMKLRGPTLFVNKLLKSLGAFPVGMPLPGAPSALAKGVIDGLVTPYEIVPAFKIHELVKYHVGFEGKRGLYTAIFVLAMNKAKYNSLSPDLKMIIDANSGAGISRQMGKTTDQGDLGAMKLIRTTKNKISQINLAATRAWKDASKSIAEDWITDMEKRGIEGRKLYNAAKASIDKFSNL